MRHKLRFSRAAIRDMEAVLAYTLERFGERKCEQYKFLIRQALADVAADPHHHNARHRPEIHPDARTFHISRRGKPARHFLLYRITAEHYVDIGRLLHDSMELNRHLPDGFEAAE
jgi:toxin ParE1/3/4